MPITYTIDPAQRLVLVTIREPYTLDDIRTIIPTMLADPRYVPGFSGLIDRRGVEDVPTTPHVQQAVRLLSAHAAAFGPCRWAVVVDRIATYGMGRMTATLLQPSGLTLEICTTLEQAYRWLGIDPPQERSTEG